MPLGGSRVYTAWRIQFLRRLTGSVFTPLDGTSVYTAWRIQCLRCLTDPVFTPLDETSVHASLASDDFLPRMKG